MIYIFTGVVLIFVFVLWKYKRKAFIPRGAKEIPIEKGLPLIGILNEVDSSLVEFCGKLQRKHGSIFGVRFGMRDVFILNDYKIIHKAFVENGNNFSGRWKLFSTLIVGDRYGIAGMDGNLWSTQRSFVLRVLKDFGMGKSRSQEIVQNECAILLEELDTLNQKCVNLTDFFSIYTINVISKFIMNKRFTRNHPFLNPFVDFISEIGKKKDFFQVLFFTMPIFDKLSWILNILVKYTTRGRLYYKVNKNINDEITEHRRLLNLSSESEDLCDRYLIKQQEMKTLYGSVQDFTDPQIARVVIELFIAGYETTATTLEWSMFFMSKYQNIQNDVYNEIINTIGKERSPTMSDKKRLNYTQAVMDEVFRLSSIVPLAIIHRVTNDLIMDGYFISKDSLILSNLYACHTDKNIWEKPKEFYPEHFLSTDSSKNIKYITQEELNPFGIGKRQCLGESLARIEYFIFFVSILQRFHVTFAESVSDLQYEEVLKPKDEIIRFPSIKNFLFTRRE